MLPVLSTMGVGGPVSTRGTVTVVGMWNSTGGAGGDSGFISAGFGRFVAISTLGGGGGGASGRLAAGGSTATTFAKVSRLGPLIHVRPGAKWSAETSASVRRMV